MNIKSYDKYINDKDIFKIKKGDFVVISINDNRLSTTPELKKFIETNIGQITSVREQRGSPLRNKNDICIKFYNVPEELKHRLKKSKDKIYNSAYGYFSSRDIVRFATSEEIDKILELKKYLKTISNYNL